MKNSSLNSASKTPQPMWKRSDVAAYYQVTTRSVANWHAQGKLPFIFINSRVIRYRPEDVQRALGTIGGN